MSLIRFQKIDNDDLGSLMLHKKKPVDKKSKIDISFLKSVMLWANLAEIDMVKQKQNRELGVLTSGIKRDGHKKNPGIRKSGN